MNDARETLVNSTADVATLSATTHRPPTTAAITPSVTPATFASPAPRPRPAPPSVDISGSPGPVACSPELIAAAIGRQK